MLSVEQKTELLDIIDKTRELVVSDGVSGVFVGLVAADGSLEISYHQTNVPGEEAESERIANSSLGLMTQLQQRLAARITVMTANQD